jgi:predicted metal-dependent hydrolase
MARIIVEDISVDIIHKKVKYLRLTVHPPDGRVRLSVPLHTSEAMARQFLNAKLSWIRKTQAEVLAKSPPAELKWIDGEKINCLGKQYTLRMNYRPGKPSIVICNDDVIEVSLLRRSTKIIKNELLLAWYRNQLSSVIPTLVAKWEPVLGVKVLEWRIRAMRTRWGSCNPKARRIWLSLELIKLPERYLDYVVVHEMTHLLEGGHGPRFRALMDRFLPNWRTLRKELTRG